MAAFYANAPLPDTNARQVTQTIRPSSTALLTIDSEDRYKDYIAAQANPTSPYNFTIVKNESLMPGFMTRIGISEIVFPWTIPNINAKTDKIFFNYSISAAPTVQVALPIPIGFYTPADLADYIQTTIRATTPLTTFSMEYGVEAAGNQLNVPAFFYQGDASGTVVQVSFEPLPYNNSAYPFPSTTKQLFDLLGFSNINTQLAYTSQGNYTLCQAIRYVDIVCNQLTNSQAQKDQTSQTIARNMLCRLYVGGASGVQSTIQAANPDFCPPGCAPTVIYRNFTTPKEIQWIPNQNIPGFLQFQVFDDAGDLLDSSITSTISKLNLDFAAAVSDWSMTMLVSEC
jgi:hypothetical protein